MPPYVAHVPQATTAQARGANWSIQWQVVIGWPVSRIGAEAGPIALGLVVFVGNRAFDHQDEGGQVAGGGLVEGFQELVADFRSRGPDDAAVTLGRPGIVPRTMSSRLGCVAAVMEIESPSHPRPAVIHKISTAGIAER